MLLPTDWSGDVEVTKNDYALRSLVEMCCCRALYPRHCIAALASRLRSSMTVGDGMSWSGLRAARTELCRTQAAVSPTSDDLECFLRGFWRKLHRFAIHQSADKAFSHEYMVRALLPENYWDAKAVQYAEDVSRLCCTRA